MEIGLDILLLLDTDCPEAFGAFGRFGGWSVGVAFVGVGFGNAEGEERERKEFEDFGGGKGVGEFG